MSVNHFSSDLPETHLWWSQQPPMMDHSPPKTHKNTLVYNHHQQQLPSTTFNFNLNHQENEQEFQETTQEQEQEQEHKEPMFEKPLTPSDVGKLNRLVIPKQHAEKYFPLGGDTADKGLLLNFEDESGKPWKFRYSYWNSSQSYVLTKGWSRFVKEKRLDAGDVVLFERDRLDGDRLFIGWRRRTATVPAQDSGAVVPAGGVGNSDGWTRLYYDAQAYPSHPSHAANSLPYQQPHCLHAGSNVQNQTAVASGNMPKRVRLFGVNLECPDESEPPCTPDGDGSSTSSTQGQAHYHNHNLNMSQMRYQHHQG